MKPNPGHCPREAQGRRVNVRLRRGSYCESWPADGRQACRWTLTGDTHDIVEYEVVK